MKRTRLVLAGVLGCVLAVGLTPTAWASTTCPAEQSNNTSTCVAGSSTSPADCAAAFAGQTDTRTGIETPLFDPPGGNVSAENVRDLLYPGSATKVFVNMMLGIIARVAPQLSIFSVGFPITMGVGLVGVMFTLPLLQGPFTAALEQMLVLFR